MDDKPISTANYLNPEDEPEDNNAEIQQLAQDKEERGEELVGGKGDGKSPLEFDPKQIILGLEVEREHTDDPLIAIEIVLDHLSEDNFYYSEKEDPQASAQFGAASDAGESDDEDMTDVLLGYQPHNVGDNVQEDIIGASGAKPSIGTDNNDNADIETANNLKKYQDYEKKDFDTLSDNDKEEYFGLWSKFKDNK